MARSYPVAIDDERSYCRLVRLTLPEALSDQEVGSICGGLPVAVAEKPGAIAFRSALEDYAEARGFGMTGNYFDGAAGRSFEATFRRHKE